jgi:hypothetical protein
MSLALSLHHFATVTMGAMATDVARGAGLLTRGEVVKGAKAIGQGLTPGLSPYKNIVLGKKVQEQYLGIADHGPAFERIVALGEAANVFHAAQQEYWKAGPAKDFVDNFKAKGLFESWEPAQIAKDIGGAAKVLGSELKGAKEKIKEKPIMGTLEVIANGISKTADSVSKPLFDYYVPNLKKGAFFAEMHDWLDKNPNANWEQQKAKAREIGDSMDNRFGEMMRDNLFFNKVTQQTLQLGFLSYSWVIGGTQEVVIPKRAVSNTLTWAIMSTGFTGTQAGIELHWTRSKLTELEQKELNSSTSIEQLSAFTVALNINININNKSSPSPLPPPPTTTKKSYTLYILKN